MFFKSFSVKRYKKKLWSARKIKQFSTLQKNKHIRIRKRIFLQNINALLFQNEIFKLVIENIFFLAHG